MKDVIGNKAINLIKLDSIGVNVPDFICLNDSECRELKIEDLASKIRNLSYPVIVRSSSEEEDSQNVSGAGKYYSIYNIHNEKDLYKAIKLCWTNRGSLDTMGIIVQKQLIPKYSGVAFMQKQNEELKCVVEMIFGLGDVLVSGFATPKRIKIDLGSEEWEIIKEDNQRIAQIPRLDDSFYEPTDDFYYDGCRLRIIGLNSRIIYGYMIYKNNYWNDIEDAIKKLIPELKTIYKSFGESDIEWVYGIDGILSIVQRRPITARLKLDSIYHDKGVCIVPGKVSGKLVRYDDYNGEQGVVIFAETLSPKEFLSITSCKGLITIENTLLSHTAILAREFNLPYYCGIAYENIEKYIDRYVEIDFETGIINEGKSEVDNKYMIKQGDNSVANYNILNELWARNYFLSKEEMES